MLFQTLLVDLKGLVVLLGEVIRFAFLQNLFSTLCPSSRYPGEEKEGNDWVLVLESLNKNGR